MPALPPPAKIDLKKALAPLYRASAKKVEEVIVPPLKYLMVDGRGDPDKSAEYADAVAALFTVSYTLKFALKQGAQTQDYSVMPLEGLWWADDWSVFVGGDKARWQWTMMILQPAFATDQAIGDALAKVRSKKNLPALRKLRVEEFTEGRCAQILHVGPFSAEGPTIEKLHAYIRERGSLAGKHHEIYLSDVRRAAPAKWKTILRQPMK